MKQFIVSAIVEEDELDYEPLKLADGMRDVFAQSEMTLIGVQWTASDIAADPTKVGLKNAWERMSPHTRQMMGLAYPDLIAAILVAVGGSS